MDPSLTYSCFFNMLCVNTTNALIYVSINFKFSSEILWKISEIQFGPQRFQWESNLGHLHCDSGMLPIAPLERIIIYYNWHWRKHDWDCGKIHYEIDLNSCFFHIFRLRRIRSQLDHVQTPHSRRTPIRTPVAGGPKRDHNPYGKYRKTTPSQLPR